jgi:signal transduction histidine kinase
MDEILWEAREELLKFNNKYRILIRIDDQLPDENLMNVSGDESLLKVAVSNLMDNACKYSANQTVEVKLSHFDNKMLVEFEDKGIGIPAAEIRKIFQPFYRASNTLGYNGSGIGLPLVRQIINNHNGTLEIRSTAGEGTCVSVSLPVTPLER